MPSYIYWSSSLLLEINPNKIIAVVATIHIEISVQ